MPEAVFPLKVLVCTSCWLVQTEDVVGPSEMFGDDYAYFSFVLDAAGSSMLAYMSSRSSPDLVSKPRTSWWKSQRMTGICCNSSVRRASAATGSSHSGDRRSGALEGIEIVEEFFGMESAARLAEHRSAALMVANNVLAHVPDINDFVAGFARLLRKDGVATFEVPHLLNLIELNQFDTIYHEHYSYLSLTAVVNIFMKNGLTVFDVEEIATHGGSLRIFAQPLRQRGSCPPAAVESMLEREAEAGVMTVEFYEALQPNAERIRDDLVNFLQTAREAGAKVVGYGAAAKGNTMLNFAGIGKHMVQLWSTGTRRRMKVSPRQPHSNCR